MIGGTAAWNWENPVPTGVSLRSVWMAASNDVWAAGDSGTLLHFDGAAWSTAASPVHSSLAALWGSSAMDIWAAGEDGTLLHYDGRAWSAVSSGTTSPLGVLSGTAADDVWASSAAIPIEPQGPTGGAVANARLLHFDGNAWTPVAVEAPTAVAALARDDVWVGTASGIRHFDGLSWTTHAATGGFVRAIAGVHGGPLFAITEQPALCNPRSGVTCPDDTLLQFDGATFAAAAGPAVTWRLTAADGAVWAFDSRGDYLFERFDPSTGWSMVATAKAVSPSSGKLANAIAVKNGEAWIVGDSGRRMHASSGVLSEPDAFRTDILWSMSGASECDVWAVGNDSLTLHRGCDRAWSSFDLATTGIFSFNSVPFRQSLSVATPAADDVWIAVSWAQIAHFDGAHWNAEAAPAQGRLYAVAKGDVYFASERNLFHRDPSGWTPVLSGWMFSGIWASSSNDVWAADAQQVYHFDGTAWSAVLARGSTPVVGKSLWGRSANDVWAAGPGGRFFHWDGSSWNGVSGPLNQIYDMFVTTDGDLWAFGWRNWGSSPAWGLFRFDGASWSELTPPTQSADLLFGVGDKVFAYGQGGAILSRDLMQR